MYTRKLGTIASSKTPLPTGAAQPVLHSPTLNVEPPVTSYEAHEMNQHKLHTSPTLGCNLPAIVCGGEPGVAKFPSWGVSEAQPSPRPSSSCIAQKSCSSCSGATRSCSLTARRLLPCEAFLVVAIEASGRESQKRDMNSYILRLLVFLYLANGSGSEASRPT